jgi:hypothetical protein
VADTLATTVADNLPPGPERDQVRAAAAILRRVAGALPGLAVALETDVRALAQALTVLDAATGAVVRTAAVAQALALADGLPVSPPPDLDALTAADLALRTALAALAERSDLGVAADATLRAALSALAARDAALGLSPWDS